MGKHIGSTDMLLLAPVGKWPPLKTELHPALQHVHQQPQNHQETLQECARKKCRYCVSSNGIRVEARANENKSTLVAEQS